jgi:hypothetical protein
MLGIAARAINPLIHQSCGFDVAFRCIVKQLGYANVKIWLRGELSLARDAVTGAEYSC